MTPVTTSQIKSLRDATGVSIGQCREALEVAHGDEQKALEFLRTQMAKIAEKKSGRTLGAGWIGAYVHGGGIGAMVELLCETDFVAKNPEFKTLVEDLSLQLSAMPTGEKEAFLAQPFIKDPNQTVNDLIKAATQKFGERIELGRFSRLAIGD